MISSAQNDIADPKLYRVYWRLCLTDILNFLGFPPTKVNKDLLHEFHKRVLCYDSTAGRSQEVVSRFIQDVCIFWAEQGLFVRTSKKQPENIQWLGLGEVIKVDGKDKTVWDLL
jgi:hypothetical protein